MRLYINRDPSNNELTFWMSGTKACSGDDDDPITKLAFFLKRNAIEPDFIFETLPIDALPDVFFDFNSAKLKPGMYKVLDRLVDLIKQNKNYKIEIQGYTDDIGKDDYNLNLSQKRAEAVKEYLLEKNISNSVTATGLGESNPKYENTNANIKAKNRRVEIYFN